jgi:hypothetical protein
MKNLNKNASHKEKFIHHIIHCRHRRQLVLKKLFLTSSTVLLLAIGLTALCRTVIFADAFLSNLAFALLVAIFIVGIDEYKDWKKCDRK